MKTVKILVGSMMVAGLLFNTSCKKDEPQTTLSEQIAEEDAAMDDQINTIDEQVDFISSSYDGVIASTTTLKSATTDDVVVYPTYTVTFPEGGRWPVVVTVDYGTSNIDVVIQSGGKPVTVAMRGKIIIEKTGSHFNPESVRTVTFDGFFVNENAIEGSQTYTNLGYNSKQNLEFSWVVDLTLTTPDAFWAKRMVNKVREMTKGIDTKSIWDDEFSVTGTVTGSNSKGWAYSHTIQSENPIIRKRVCRFPVYGKIDVVNPLTTFTLDYGTGECDAYATVTDKDGVITEIILGRRWQKR